MQIIRNHSGFKTLKSNTESLKTMNLKAVVSHKPDKPVPTIKSREREARLENNSRCSFCYTD